ncbi:xanthine dehydrogenase family protein molybdopterin-binding subunit [Sphingomonas sp. NFR15]|uniref:xanthine dehydrogenase family protein molybdopterin-binding subunit n=1 Tax=Sphingomonas sp. NFR15 TaxID=1566282 RepID=UPI0008875752|nr:molybdopterin cofactor-binding domain-containing protein [Sphingomonas sp. NFR15]SDA19454.1 Tat (twin-arginine translocation) pathway signal sequence [Sphingomonas sp. NFR15]
MSRLPTRSDGASPFSRRSFLVASGAAGVAFGFSRVIAAIDPAVPGSVPAPPTGPLFEPTMWFGIDAAGIVTVNIIRAEMGQHVGTALARILADELEADWDKVRIVHVDSDPKWGLMVTGGSWSVWQTFPVFSQAGAAGRIALIEAGAKLMGANPAKCTAKGGAVHFGGRSVTYGDIARTGAVARQFTPDELKALPIKPVKDRRLIGRETHSLDIDAKTNGTAIYGIDATLPGMVYARPKLPPTRNGSKVVSVDDAAAKKVKGYLRYLVLDDPSDTVPGWVMVIASSYYAALKATDLLQVVWTPGPGADVTEQTLQDHARALVARADGGIQLDIADDDSTPDFGAAAATTIEQIYTTATVLHFQLEPLNALAFEKDGVFEIHTGNQWQSLILPTLAKALAVPETKVVLRSYLLGGGFGRRLNGDYTIPAALATKALGRPVKMILTREDDVRFDSVRSPSVQRLRMRFDDGGQIQAMEHHACAGWPTQVIGGPTLLAKTKKGGQYDPFAISGADHWYDVGHQKVRAVANDLANTTFRPGWLRSVGPGWTNWALESFIDEAAHHTKSDPVAFRLKLLTGKGRNAGSAPNAVGGALRQAEVVRRVAEKAGWGSKRPADTGLGIATSFGQERDMPTWVACAAQVHVDRATGIVRVEKLTLVVDAGTIVDPDGALAQVQGGALWGLSMALHEGTEFVAGQVKDTNLNTYNPLRIADTPDIDVSFVESENVPVGLGEPATTVVAPAIGNAIYAAIGVRLRHIPISPAAVLSGLNAK